MTRTLILISGFAVALTACVPVRPAPLTVPQDPRQRILVQREFRLGTFDFGRTAGDAHELSAVIPAMLLTELRDGGRFAIYEGGNIRSGGRFAIYEASSNRADGSRGQPLNEANASEYVDGYLSGTLTTIAGQQVCLDLRLSNAVTHEVLYARPVCIAVANDGRVDRDAVKRVAEEITRAIKQVGNGKVTSADGHIVFCDKGGKAGVSRGMVAYIVGTGDTVRDTAMHKEVQRYTKVDPSQLTTVGTPVIVGEMYIVAVEETYSVGLLHKGSYVMPGDTVFFK